ncbi:class I glutamine amidotransferase-like protein [Cantharellus anzutake]|uniref:class I glutamine amidotransferase-like protein n=1 Tax=Cantharellus anzutake TaxID=1750568 RepID=UPI00190372E8|nr:class I glutamine amidotransferase-like protein [Cantharellus anzutake]KAF8326698.1 class I glutamine amidotransferase-like protein [Cantharellus anzutake]
MSSPSHTNQTKILFILSSANRTLTGEPTGWYLPEAAHPYYQLVSQYNITFAAPLGPNPPLDPKSVELFKEDAESVKFLNDEVVKGKLASALVLKEVSVTEYDVIFYVGGHGPVIDLSVDQDNQKLVEDAWHKGKIISAVCHGPAALVSAETRYILTKNSILKGKRVTGFSNVEEGLAGTTKTIPFLLEDRIKDLGGLYEKAEKPWDAHVVVDGNLITGQNPASARPLAQAIAQELAKRVKAVPA